MLQPFTNIDILTHGAGLATEGIASSSKLARGTPYAHFRARRCGLACHIKGLRVMGFEGDSWDSTTLCHGLSNVHGTQACFSCVWCVTSMMEVRGLGIEHSFATPVIARVRNGPCLASNEGIRKALYIPAGQS